MRENINKVSQRGERLDSLQDKTDNLAVSAQGFRRGANRVRKQMWWKDMKMRMCLIVGIIILLVSWDSLFRGLLDIALEDGRHMGGGEATEGLYRGGEESFLADRMRDEADGRRLEEYDRGSIADFHHRSSSLFQASSLPSTRLSHHITNTLHQYDEHDTHGNVS